MRKVALTGALVAPFLLVSLALGTQACAQEAVRPAVGKPLEAAKAELARRNFSAASGDVAKAERVKGRSAYEDFLIEEMRGAIAQQSGDTDAAAKIYADVINSGRVSGAQLQEMLLAEVSLSYQEKNYADVITWSQRYYKAGGKDSAVRTLVIQAYYLQRDYANAVQLQQQEIGAELAARKVPSEDQLQLLAACQKALGQSSPMTKTMELLVTYYPKQSYWADLVYAVQTTPGFSDRLDLDLDQFKLRTKLLSAEPDFMEMIQLALGDNNPGEALQVIDAARAAGAFGQPGKADRENRLIALAQTTAQQAKTSLDSQSQQLTISPATTGQQLFDLGVQYCGFQNYDRGLALMQQALSKGGLQRVDMAQLQLGVAYIDAGQKTQAMSVLQQVSDQGDGAYNLAQLWLLWLKTQRG